MKSSAALVLMLLTAAFAVGQGNASKSQRMSQEIANLYQAGKFDEAIPIAEEVVQIERRATDHKDLVNALENLAHLKLSRFKVDTAALNGGTVAAGDVRGTVTRLRKDATDAEAVLREAIELADREPAVRREQRISLRNRLAWLLYAYKPPDPETDIQFDKLNRDRFGMRSKARFLKRASEADSLFKEALSIASADASATDTSGLQTSFQYAEFALATGELEKALELLESSIREVDRRFGKTNRDLALPLQKYIVALTAAGQEDEAFEAMSRLVRVTGQSSGLPKTLVNLTFRADKAFEPFNGSAIEASARANKETIALRSRGANINGSIEAILSSSTVGRDYYGNPGTVSILRVPVKVLVDEAGKVLEAEAVTPDKDLKQDAEKIVREWNFRPFVRGGKPHRMRGYVEPTIFADAASTRF